VFSSSEKNFAKTKVEIRINKDKKILDNSQRSIISSTRKNIVNIIKKKGDPIVSINFLTENQKAYFPAAVVKRIVSQSILKIIFSSYFPNPFILSAERTGIALFRNELNYSRNHFFDQLNSDEEEDELERKQHNNFSLPVYDNLYFVREIESITKKDSFIQKKHPQLIDFFSKSVCGGFKVTENNELYFTPDSDSKLNLTMVEASSSVRALLSLSFYLKHSAKKGDILMIDEPELNLHPKNQRLMARLFARLANIGINVFITTHSDYIIKELNTLIMLNQDLPHVEKIIAKEGYQKDELIDIKDIRVYNAREDLIKASGSKRKVRGNTLVPADIDQQTGIGIDSFDDSINEMNEIQSEILFGG
jgi:hypothetical protein